MKAVFVFLMSLACLLGADATGTWIGTLTTEGRDPGPAHLVLKQDGNKLSGTAGPDADQQMPIANGTVEGNTVKFDVHAGEGRMRFVLQRDGDKISGNVQREREDETVQAKLEVRRKP